MKRKRKDSEYSHCVFIPILLLNFLLYGVVSGLDLPQAGGKKTIQSGLSNLSYPSLSAQGLSHHTTITSNEENVPRTDDSHRNAQSNDVSTLQSIQNLYHEAFLLLKNVLKSENRTDTVSSTNFDFQNTINSEHENNKTLSGRKNNVLGKSPLPPFKTRQNNSTFLGNKTYLPRKITYSKKIYNKNDSTGKLWENLRTPLNVFGKLKLQENPTGLTQLGNHSKLNRKTFNETFLRNDTNQSILRSKAINRKDSLSKNSTSHDNMKHRSVNNIHLSLSSNNNTRHSDEMYSYAGLTRNTTNHNDKINSRLSRNSTKHDHMKQHTVNGLGNDLAKIETFSKLGTLSSTLNLSMFDSENIFNNSLNNVTERHSNQTLEHSSLLDNGSFVNSLNNSGIYLRTKDQNQTRNRSVGETSSWNKSLIKLETNSSQSLSSSGNLLITQDIIMQLSEKKDRSPRVKDNLTCSTGDVQHNSTLSAGLNAGYFTEEGKVKTMDDCIYHCCAKRKCNVAFMIKESCFLVQCHDKSSCRSRKAQSSSFMPRLAFIFRQDQQTDDILFVNKETIQSKTKEHCNYHKVIQNVTLRSGLEAGLFTPHGEVTSFQECVRYCCQEEHCDVAFMVHNLCYSVHCKNKHSCAPSEGLGYKTTTSLCFIARGNNQPLVDVSDLKIEHQKHLEEAKQREKVPSSCAANDVVSPVLRNVKLRGGLKAGHFTHKGKVSDYHQCVNYCCKDKRCNVALTLKNNCFLVTCKTYSGCLTSQTLKTDFDPQIVYINWKTPTDKVLTKGNILYKMLGCWQEDERLENIVSLEGTDPILTDSYKLRKNAVERCAVAARKRSFNAFSLHNGGECRSGLGIEDVYKTKGKSNGCSNGVGEHSSTYIYYFKRNGSIGNYGCWNTIQNYDGFVTLESTDGRIMGGYKNRYDAFLKCAETAMDQHYTLFALRDGGQCFGGLKATTKYKKHGVSRRCKNGLGSGASKSVYQIIGSTTFKPNHNDGSFLELSSSKGHQLHRHELSPKVFLFTVGNKKTNFRGKKIKVINWQDKAVKKQANISYKAGPVTRNIFIHGKNAGNFTSRGAVKNMAECIQYCGKQLNCSVAFMVRKYCFSVKCFTQESCATKSAASTIFHPKVSFISHFSPRHLQSGATPSKQCQTNKIYENVTLFGGINSGNFTDLGWRKNMNECIHQCCQRQRCDVAFMLGSDCYGVTCKTKQLCGTKPAKHVDKYKPRIAYIQSPEDDDKEESLSSCWSGEVIENHTLTGGIDAGVFYSNGNTETMSSCMKYCCQQKDCDLAFRIDQGCYTVRCKDKKQCRPRKARETHYRPQISYKKHTTFIHHDSRGNKYDEDDANHTDTDHSKNKLVNTSKNESTKSIFNNGKTKPVIKPARLPHSCEVGVIHYNVTLKMGMHSGVFNKLGRAKTMEDCIEMCCHEKESDAAFMLGKLCYSVRCYNSDLCQTRPAFISNINKLNINPAVAFLNTAPKQHTDYSRSEIERGCVGTTVKENATLLGGSSAGNFIDNGERGTMEECISACCNTPSCDVAFMNDKICYSVQCSNKTLCQAVRAEPTLNKPAVAYVARYLDSDTQDLQLSAATSQCPLESINKLEVLKNKSLIGGFESGNYTFLGRTKDMITCIQQCCGLGKCDVAYYIDGNCYGIECFSKNLCSVDDRTPDSTSTEISIIKNLSDGESRFYSRYVFPGFSAILVVVIIIGWLYWTRSKKILSRLK